MEAQECRNIISTASCPPAYECAEPKYPIRPLPDPCVGPTANDNCHSEQSYQQCKLLQEDGCMMLQATLSCPPLYSCASFNTDTTQCVAPDECQTDESFLECAQLEAQGCDQIISTMSCPPQYSCAVPSQCVAPDECQTEESYQECLSLEAQGCEVILSTSSCPPQNRCGGPIPSPFLV